MYNHLEFSIFNTVKMRNSIHKYILSPQEGSNILMVITLALFLMYYFSHYCLLVSVLHSPPTQVQPVPQLERKPVLGWGRGRGGNFLLTCRQISMYNKGLTCGAFHMD